MPDQPVGQSEARPFFRLPELDLDIQADWSLDVTVGSVEDCVGYVNLSWDQVVALDDWLDHVLIQHDKAQSGASEPKPDPAPGSASAEAQPIPGGRNER